MNLNVSFYVRKKNLSLRYYGLLLEVGKIVNLHKS